jgi:hypothetical protein
MVRAAAVAKWMTLLSAIGTSLVGGLIAGWQVLTWAISDEWSPFPISRALVLAQLDRPAVYVIASASNPSDDDLLESMGGWLLDLPTSGLLLGVAMLLMALSISVASIEKLERDRQITAMRARHTVD